MEIRLVYMIEAEVNSKMVYLHYFNQPPLKDLSLLAQKLRVIPRNEVIILSLFEV